MFVKSVQTTQTFKKSISSGFRGDELKLTLTQRVFHTYHKTETK